MNINILSKIFPKGTGSRLDVSPSIMCHHPKTLHSRSELATVAVRKLFAKTLLLTHEKWHVAMIHCLPHTQPNLCSLACVLPAFLVHNFHHHPIYLMHLHFSAASSSFFPSTFLLTSLPFFSFAPSKSSRYKYLSARRRLISGGISNYLFISVGVVTRTQPGASFARGGHGAWGGDW